MSVNFFQFDEKPLLVEENGKVLEGASKAANGLLRSHEAVQFDSVPRVTEVVSKSIRGGGLERYTRQEVDNLLALEKELTEDEIQWIKPLLGIKRIDGKVETFYIEKCEGDFLQYVKNGLPARDKGKIAQGILTTLDILIRHQYIITDVKPANMLYQGLLGRMCDFDTLRDLKTCDWNSLLDAQERAMPLHVPLREALEIRKLIRKKDVTVEEKLYRQMKFAVGSCLYFFFVGDRPYPTLSCNTIEGCPTNILRHCTQDPSRSPPNPNRLKTLLDAGCEGSLASQILDLINYQ